MIYLDSSALVKIIRQEPDSVALRGWLARRHEELISSALVRVEAERALARVEPAALSGLRAILPRLHQLTISDEVLDAATTIGVPALRSLDAIHLATAVTLRHSLTEFVAYDKRLCEAARAHGLPVSSPS